MVFVVISNIVCQQVQRSIVAVRLLFEPVPEVVLCYEVPCAGVQTSCEETAHKEIDKRSETEMMDKKIIEDDLNDNIEQVPLCQALRADKRWTESVE